MWPGEAVTGDDNDLLGLVREVLSDSPRADVVDLALFLILLLAPARSGDAGEDDLAERTP
jgi:hypothetical protein